jgi:small-conductance mechanosensitive channel
MFLEIRRLLYVPAALLGVLLCLSVHASGQETKPPVAGPPPEGQKGSEKGIAQLALLADELEERSSALRREIENFFDKPAADAAWSDVRRQLSDLSGRLNKVQANKRYNYDHVLQIKTDALTLSKSLKKQLDSTNQTALQLETRTAEWQNEKKRWGELKTAVPKEVVQPMLKPVAAKGQQAIDGALALLTRQMAPVLEAQQKFADQRARLSKLVLQLDGLLQRAIKDVFRRSAPSMLSLDYYAQLVKPQSYEAAGQFRELIAPARDYMSKYGWAVVLQGIAFILIAHGIRRHRRFFEEYERWGFISGRPVAAGLFAAVIFLGWLPGLPAPLIVRLASLAVVCLSTARLVGGLLHDLPIRRAVYSLAFLIIVTEALQLMDIPLPFFRVYTFLVALGGLLLGIRLALRRPQEDSPIFVWIFRAGALLFAVALFAELGGYNGLSSDLIECSLKSILSLSVCWMVMILVRGALEWAFYTTRIRSIAILRTKADAIIRKSTRIIGFFLGLLLLAANLYIWGVYESPVAALDGFLSLGFTVGKWRVTLGLLLTAGMILYGSFLASYAVQAALTEGLFTVREVQMGARFSIARLMHYGFAMIGILLALGVLGVDLRNITILAGALGVGIGFGLQGIVNNFVCGLILLFERPVKVGDLVEIESQWGQIKKIGLRATIVETFDQAEVVMPNSELVNNRVKNWTLTHRGSRLTIPVGAAYGSDVSGVLEILRRCAEDHPMVLKAKPPTVLFTRFGESSLDFELRVFTDVDHRLTVQSELLQAIDRRFREAGIEIPFPQRDLHIRNVESPVTRDGRKPDTGLSEAARSPKTPGFLISGT